MRDMPFAKLLAVIFLLLAGIAGTVLLVPPASDAPAAPTVMPELQGSAARTHPVYR
ncbi:hypothetical protein SAMN05880570_1354 [Paenibacillus sp. RU4T]|nr:hypothetical protein SAMN05880555_1355 [Paenibacillus sp. RU4X]SIQ53351.1 hypothetical protein SAMN05880570_1354 [Paenibacillus sp. RU4T]